MKKILLFVFITSTLFALSSFYKANAQCTSCVEPFPYSCQYGTMCCHRNGCPSYVCFDPTTRCQSLHGSGATGSWIWADGSHDSYLRCYPTPSSFRNYTGIRCDEGCVGCGGGGDDDDGGGGNSQPLAYITVPSGCPGTSANPVVLPNKVGQNNTFSVTATDPDANLSVVDLYFRPWDRNDANYTDPFTPIGQQSCSGASCSPTFTWDTSRSGWSVVYPNVTDALGAWCSGLPYHTNDCDPDRSETDDIDNCKVYANRPPLWNPIGGHYIVGPSQVRANRAVMLYPSVYDPDHSIDPPHVNSHQVRTSWADTCSGTFPTINQLRIRAKGDSAGGVGPTMQVYKAPLSSSFPYTERSLVPACTFVVSNSNYPSDQNVFNYLCNINAQNSVLDIVFPNDYYVDGQDRNLYVDWVEFVLADGSVTRVQAEGLVEPPAGSSDPALPAKVVYDRGTAWNTAFDGADLDPSPFNLGSHVMLAWNGALRFGPIWKAPSTVTSCTITAASSDRYHAAETRTKTINVCGAAPAAPTITCPSPVPSFQYTASLSVPLTWNSVSAWGNTCSLLSKNYLVYMKKPGDADFSLATTYPHNLSNPATHTWIYTPASELVGTYEWRVVSNNNEYMSPPSNSCLFEIEPAPLPGWVTSIDGDVYFPGTTMVLPSSPNVNWSGTKLRLARGMEAGNLGTVFSGGTAGKLEMYVDRLPAVRNDLISQSNKWARYFPVASLWPSQFRNTSLDPFFSVPPQAVPLPGLSSLSPNGVYYTANSGNFSEERTYNLTGAGVAVIYYTGVSNLSINRYIRHADNDPSERILLITNRNITITSTVGAADPPSQTTRANVEMGIITSGNITFPKKNPDGTDSTVIMEGPLVAANSISFLRSRGVSPTYNEFPSEVVRYNSNYIYRLTQQERDSSFPNYSGLFKYTIYWESGK